MSRGIKKIDELGRIVVPKEVRSALGVTSGDTASFEVMDNKLVLTFDKKRLSDSERTEKALDKIQYIIDYGFDYDGFNSVESLKGLIDMLVDYAKEAKDILKGEEDV